MSLNCDGNTEREAIPYIMGWRCLIWMNKLLNEFERDGEERG